MDAYPVRPSMHHDSGSNMAAVFGGPQGPDYGAPPATSSGRGRTAASAAMAEGHGDIISHAHVGYAAEDSRAPPMSGAKIGSQPSTSMTAGGDDWAERRAEAAGWAARGNAGSAPFATSSAEVEEKKAPYGDAQSEMGDIMGGRSFHAGGGGGPRSDGSTGVSGKVGARGGLVDSDYGAAAAEAEAEAARNKERFVGSRPW